MPQRHCSSNLTARSPEYSPLRPPPSSSEDSGSEHSSRISSTSRDGPTEIPKLCPPPYGFHFGAQKKGPPCSAGTRAAAEDGPLSPQGPDVDPPLLSPPTGPDAPLMWRERALSPKRIPKPPPPYTRLVRTPSLKEYPNHAIRLLPREIVSEELKSWHQRIQLQKMDQLGPAPLHLPSFQQVGGVRRATRPRSRGCALTSLCVLRDRETWCCSETPTEPRSSGSWRRTPRS